jgi:predicted deacylase
MILLLCGLIGCVENQRREMADHPALAPVKRETVVTSGPRVSVVGKSVNGKDIVMTEFGHGDRPVLIMAGIHGNERATVYVAEQLVLELRQNLARAAGVPVAVITVANPDGYEANTRHNARGVDLNRNFPAKNWKKATKWRNFGGSALSEPESRAIFETIESLNPRLIISIHSIDDQRHCNNFDGPGEQVARVMSQHNHYPTVPTIGYATPGSLGSYAGIDRQIAMVTLELPREASGPKGWEENRDALFAALAAVK